MVKTSFLAHCGYEVDVKGGRPFWLFCYEVSKILTFVGQTPHSYRCNILRVVEIGDRNPLSAATNVAFQVSLESKRGQNATAKNIYCPSIVHFF